MKTATMFLAFIAMVVLANTASAQNGATNIREEVCGFAYNPCCDETIEICLDAHWTIGKDGSLQRVNAQGKGTGSNGTNYVMIVNQNQHVNIQDNGAGNYTVTLSQKLVATGNSDCTFTLHYTIHVTINSNGELTSEVENIRIECENGTII